MDKLTALLKEKKIQRRDYLTYLLFEANDVGRELLKHMKDSVLMEEPMQPTNDMFAWHDGRRSVWRDIQRMIDNVNKHIEELS